MLERSLSFCISLSCRERSVAEEAWEAIVSVVMGGITDGRATMGCEVLVVVVAAVVEEDEAGEVTEFGVPDWVGDVEVSLGL